VRDTALQTGNWYAARSIDSGQTWSYISPYTTFAATDGGFCCDQRTIYIPSADITVWLLQYSYSGTTQKAGQRIAIANGRADLQAGTNGSWHSYYFSRRASAAASASGWTSLTSPTATASSTARRTCSTRRAASPTPWCGACRSASWPPAARQLQLLAQRDRPLAAALRTA
jgi:hypothetical protein